MNRQNAIELLVEQCNRALAVAFVLPLIHILNDQDIVLDLKGLSVKFLTADISDTDVNVVTASWVGNTPDELGLAVKEDELDPALDVVEGDSAHSAPVTHVLLW